MLVLTRKIGEKIVIDNDIVITLVNVQRDTVKLGFEAPSNIRIDRLEVHEARQKQSETK